MKTQTAIETMEQALINNNFYVGGLTDEAIEYYYNKLQNDNNTYDVLFNDSDNSNSKGFAVSFDTAMAYITANNGTNESYFADYKGGTVSIFCNETQQIVFETTIK